MTEIIDHPLTTPSSTHYSTGLEHPPSYVEVVGHAAQTRENAQDPNQSGLNTQPINIVGQIQAGRCKISEGRVRLAENGFLTDWARVGPATPSLRRGFVQLGPHGPSH